MDDLVLKQNKKLMLCLGNTIFLLTYFFLDPSISTLREKNASSHQVGKSFFYIMLLSVQELNKYDHRP